MCEVILHPFKGDFQTKVDFSSSNVGRHSGFSIKSSDSEVPNNSTGNSKFIESASHVTKFLQSSEDFKMHSFSTFSQQVSEGQEKVASSDGKTSSGSYQSGSTVQPIVASPINPL